MKMCMISVAEIFPYNSTQTGLVDFYVLICTYVRDIVHLGESP